MDEVNANVQNKMVNKKTNELCYGPQISSN